MPPNAAFAAGLRRQFVLGFTVGCMMAVQQPGLPGLVFVGRSDTNAIGFLDPWTPNTTVNGMVYRTRLVQSDPADPASRGQEIRALRKRIKRVIVFGSGTLSAGTITVTCDGKTESYTNAIADANQQILLRSDFVASLGRVVDVTITLSGSGVVIRDVQVEYVAVG